MHAQGQTFADVTEGTKTAWERLHYDWSDPQRVVDQPLLPGPFGDLVRSAEGTLRGPGWRYFWDGLTDGMGIESLPPEARTIVAQTSAPRADLLLGYWDEILHGSNAATRTHREADLAAIAARGAGYHWVTASDPAPAYAQWLTDALPGVQVTVMPGGHFPHLAHPADLAKLLAAVLGNPAT